MKPNFSLKWSLIFALTSPVISFAQLKDCPEASAEQRENITSEYLSADVKDPYVYSSEEEMGIFLCGILPNTQKHSKLGRILPHYSDDPQALMIEEVSTEKEARGLGVATVLYEHLIQQSNPQKLGGTPKVVTNRDSVLGELIKNLRDESQYAIPNEADDKQKQFSHCCSFIFDPTTHKTKPEFVSKVGAALQVSPTAKIGKKLGFKIIPSSIEFELHQIESGPSVHINFMQEREVLAPLEP